MSHTCKEVLQEVAAERQAQDRKWGEQNHEDGTGFFGGSRQLADMAREQCEKAFREGHGSWNHILTEEFMEAMAEHEPIKLRTELLQVAAVAVAWIEAIDRRTK